MTKYQGVNRSNVSLYFTPYYNSSRHLHVTGQNSLNQLMTCSSAYCSKFCLLFLRPKWGWHLNVSVTPSDFRPLSHPFVPYAPWIGGSFLSLGLGQPWPCLDLLPLLALLFGIA